MSPKWASKTRAAAVVLLGAGCLNLAAGLYIPVKAAVAQVLLDRAWQRTTTPEDRVRPWPWADTWPVARLRSPATGDDVIVLAGAQGAVLAFGPGRVDGTGAAIGNTVLGGHRDTHFAFLRHLRLGDELVLERPGGDVKRYVVAETLVTDETDVRWLEPTARATLTLVTCYPFDAVRPGGPLRYLVRAAELNSTKNCNSSCNDQPVM